MTLNAPNGREIHSREILCITYAGKTTLRIVDGTASGFNQAKCWKYVWRLNLELLPPQPSRTWAGSERRRRRL